MPRYAVSFQGPPDEAPRALRAAGLDKFVSASAHWVEAHWVESGQGPDMTLKFHTVFVEADSEQAAVATAKAALEGRGEFEEFSAKPVHDF